MSKILVISQKSDPHIEMVAKYLDEEPIIYDPLSAVEDHKLSYHFDGSGLKVDFNGQNLSEVDIIWMRKPFYFNEDNFSRNQHIPQEFSEFCLNSYNAHVKALYELFEDKLWISKPHLIRRAQNKLLQYEYAAKLGLRIPETLMTNNGEDAKRFLEQNDNQVIIKQVFNMAPLTRTTSKKLNFTTDVRGLDLKLLDNVSFSPYIFQKEIKKGLDLRVTVLRDKIFTCSISYEEDSTLDTLDWRKYIQVESKLKYKSYDLPRDLELKLIELVKNLGLEYGAIDLIFDGEVYWFLEINPAGQWGFVELEAGLPISEAFASLFKSFI